MITNDKRLYLNFNYVQINKYKTDTYKLKKNFYTSQLFSRKM